MAKETQIGQLVIDLKIKTEALEKGLETAKQKIQSIEQENKKLENSNADISASFIAMSAAAVASLISLGSAIEDCANKYTSYVNSMNALNKTAQATNNTIEDVQNIIEEVNEFKLLDETDLNSAIKNLLLYGYTAKQASDILKVLQDSAVGNRQECYSLSEAVRVTTEGIRMENSVLSDAAGVQKNIAKMYEEYADKIGKSTDALTQVEKAQAVYNGIMAEASMFTGAAAEVANSYQGQQAQLNATTLELQRTFGESMIPTMTELNKVQKDLLKGLNDLISEHKAGTSAVVTFGATLLTGSIAVAGITKAVTLFKESQLLATIATNGFTAALMANPIFAGAALFTVGLSAILAFFSAYNTNMQEEIDRLEEMTKKTNELNAVLQNFEKNGMYSETETKTVENEVAELENIVYAYNELENKLNDVQARMNEIKENSTGIAYSLSETRELNKLSTEYGKITKEIEEMDKSFSESGKDIGYYRDKLNILNKTLTLSDAKTDYLRVTNQKANREALINIAQTKADIQGKQELLNILKEGKTTTEAYADAKNQLVKVYPELAKVNENTIASTQAMIDAENAAADAEWVNAQVAIQASILEVSAMASNSEQIKIIAAATQQSVEQVTASLQNQINVLSNLAKLTPEDFKGSVTTTYVPRTYTNTSSGATKTYSNERLDNYKKEIEHKKALDQLSLQQEISMYEYALRNYTKTADERMELREKIYSLNKELAQKEKEILTQQTEDYETYIQQKKNIRGAAYDITEQTRDYNQIIQLHKNYLNQIMKDERLSLDERKEIYREELQTIRDYEQQKRDLRVQEIDNTVSQLTDAITKQLEEMQEKDTEYINKQIEEIEKLKEIRINAINAEYDAKIEAIEKELEALDKAEQQKSRDEEDAEYERKKKRLEELVAFEHDATTKANYQKKLADLIADYQKALDERALEDKKEALNAQKDLLQEEQDSKVEAIEEETEKQKEIYDKQLEELEKYYDEQIDMAQETAEKMLLNVEKNQDKILNLLKNYGDAYEITGQSLGEKLAQGINEGIAGKIENIIQKIQDTIDSNLEAKIKEWTSDNYRYEAGANKPQTTNVNITQNNYIEQNPEMPSETYRKLNNVSQKLAEEFAGM